MQGKQTILISDLPISAHLLYEEAQKRKINCQLIDNHTILMKKGNQSWYVRGSRTSFQSSVGKSIADRKELTKLILQRNGIPTARFVISKKDTKSELLYKELKLPVVIKPNLGSQGEGVIVGVTDYLEIKKYLTQYTFNENIFLIVEEMLVGEEFRILCIDYRFFAATKREPAFVVGDGRATIKALIELKNTHPWRGEGHSKPLSKIIINDLVIANLSKQKLSLESVLAEDEKIYLRRTANLSTGGESIDFTDAVCEENKKLFEKIARICDLNSIGIDVMCLDLSKPISQQKDAGIIEVNASPGLRMHHFPLQGKPRNAAGAILDMVEKNKK